MLLKEPKTVDVVLGVHFTLIYTGPRPSIYWRRKL
jgi:hypothetical protein